MKIEWESIRYVKSGTAKNPKEFPQEDGVYVIAQKNDNVLEARYVGRGNINDRIDYHESNDEDNECVKSVMKDRVDKVKVYYVTLSGDEDRKNIEYTLYKHYKNNNHRLCNKTVPEGKWITDLSLPF